MRSSLFVTATGLTAAAGLTSASLSSSTCSLELAPPPPAMAMAFRMLGNTGLQISVLSFGFWATFGVKSGLGYEQEGINRAKECMRVVRRAGVNLFDNAETYGTPQGEAERIMGEAIVQLRRENPSLWRRSDLVITTKIFWGGEGVNEKGLSRKHLREGLDASLKRLKMDYVDLVFCHRPDPLTPTETVVRSMTDLIRCGKATAWGTSEWSAQQITEAVWIARAYGLEPPQFEQPQYNMFHRERFEQEYAPMYQPQYNMGTTIWSPLASGLLTGKYNNTIPEGSRMTTPGMNWLVQRLHEWRSEGKIEKVRRLTALAEGKLECTMTQLAIAWCLLNPKVTTVLLGATKPSQLEENLGAIAVARRMTAEDLAEIEEVLANKPAPYSGYGGTGMRSMSSL